MIDPITLSAAVSAANVAYSGIKKAIQVSRDIEDVTGEIGKWMTAVSDVDNINKKASNPSHIDRIFNGSVEEVALQSFAAKKKMHIIKTKFNENTELGKELALYNIIIGKKFSSDKKADYFINEVIKQRNNLNNSTLRR